MLEVGGAWGPQVSSSDPDGAGVETSGLIRSAAFKLLHLLGRRFPARSLEAAQRLGHEEIKQTSIVSSQSLDGGLKQIKI